MRKQSLVYFCTTTWGAGADAAWPQSFQSAPIKECTVKPKLLPNKHPVLAVGFAKRTWPTTHIFLFTYQTCCHCFALHEVASKTVVSSLETELAVMNFLVVLFRGRIKCCDPFLLRFIVGLVVCVGCCSCISICYPGMLACCAVKPKLCPNKHPSTQASKIHLNRTNTWRVFYTPFPKTQTFEIETQNHAINAIKRKNKMKPTNPNADTYVDKQRQYLITYLSHFQQTRLWDTLSSHTEVTLL